MKMTGHHHILLFVVLYVIPGDSVNIESFPTDTTVCNNETATFSCEVFGSGVNWCIDNNCMIDGSLLHTNYTTVLKPASGTLYSVLHVYVPLHYNNSLVKCCVVPGNNCSQVVTLRVYCPKNKNDSSKEIVASINITPAATSTVKTIALTETPWTNSTRDFTPSNSHWPVIVGITLACAVLLLIILAAGATICHKKGCRISGCQPEVNSGQEEKETDIVNGSMTEEPSIEKEVETTTTNTANMTVTEHEQESPSSSDLATPARRNLRPPLKATRRTTDDSLPWGSDDTGEPSVNNSPLSFCTQLSGKPKNIGPQLHRSPQEELKTSQMNSFATSSDHL